MRKSSLAETPVTLSTLGIYTTEHGTTATMQTANIGKTPAAPAKHTEPDTPTDQAPANEHNFAPGEQDTQQDQESAQPPGGTSELEVLREQVSEFARSQTETLAGMFSSFTKRGAAAICRSMRSGTSGDGKGNSMSCLISFPAHRRGLGVNRLCHQLDAECRAYPTDGIESRVRVGP